MKTNILKNAAPEGYSIDLTTLYALARKPELWAPHEALFWNDPHISKQMLKAHLDPDWDAASKPHSVIDRAVAWIAGSLGFSKDQSLLDLGCGPGLYCSRFAKLGLKVTGVDFSRNSLDYAEQCARTEGLEIDYICQDYLTLDFVDKFDAAAMIDLDFSVLSDSQRDGLLKRIHKALKPGGFFVVDIAARNYPANHPEGGDDKIWWTINPEGGFWKPGPYLELGATYIYREHDASLEQVVIIEKDGTVSTYRIWNRSYTLEGITAILKSAGFRLQGAWADLTGKTLQPDSAAIGLIAVKV